MLNNKTMEVFRCGNNIIQLEKLPTEPYEHFRERCFLITNKLRDTEKITKQKYDHLVTLSKIHINVKYLGCLYSSNIMQELALFTVK